MNTNRRLRNKEWYVIKMNYWQKQKSSSLDNFINYKEHWYGKRRIEWNPVGHSNTNEGPHVTVRDYNGERHGVTDKIFIKERGEYDDG